MKFEPPASLRLPSRLARWVPQLEAARLCYAIDPHTLAAILDRESRGGNALSPNGPTGTGDKGHGRGLAQVDDRAHPTFIAAKAPDGHPLWQDPTANILFGALVLRTALEHFSWDYPPAICAYNAGISAAAEACRGFDACSGSPERISALDAVTTGGNYVTDTLRRRDLLLQYVPPPPVPA